MHDGKKNEELLLQFDHNVVEHLGLKLYQNRPSNVIAELVSNGWDADANNVWVDLHTDAQDGSNSFVAVADDGTGMSRQIIRDRFLIIGFPKRPSGSPDMISPGGRKPMGRKGIGKLAPFGIAAQVDVISVAPGADGARRLNWFRMNLKGIRAASEKRRYHPEEIISNGVLDNLDVIRENDETGAVADFLNRLEESKEKGKIGSGTLLLMRDLSVRHVITPNQVLQSMGRRFTVTLLRPDFTVFVNEIKVTEKEALPKFQHRIPESGYGRDIIDGNEVRYWAGFVEAADWPQDEAGVGVYTHGKIAQDRPFTFGQKGREIIARYMYAVVEADWLDELPDDVVSTDRTSINWEHEQTQLLQDWGKRKVREWLEAHLIWRTQREARDVKERLEKGVEHGDVPKFSPKENDEIVKMVAKITPSLPRTTEGDLAKNELLATVANAWSNRPMRELLKGLWDRASKGELAGDVGLHPIVQELHQHSVPEFMSLGVTFAQRAYALSLMYDMIHFGREIDLQELLEAFPWIIFPEGNLLVADKTMKTVMDKIAERQPEVRIGRELRSVSERQEPDFVFMRDPSDSEIVVVEIKHPSNALTIENRRQLSDYLDLLSVRYSQLKRSGILIGSGKEGVEASDSRMKIYNWTEIFSTARKGYVDLMAAMLKAANPSPDDARLFMMAEFGGEKTWELLRRVAEKDDDLADLFARFEKLHARANGVS